MGFPEMVELVNRTSKELVYRFDGQDFRLKPGVNIVPKVTVPYAKNQLVLMGSEDEIDVTDFVSLVGRPNTKDDVTPLEQNEDELNRTQLSKIIGDTDKILVKGKKKPRASDAHVRVPGAGIADLQGRE